MKLYTVIEAADDNFCRNFENLNFYYEYYPKTLLKEMKLKNVNSNKLLKSLQRKSIQKKSY